MRRLLIVLMLIATAAPGLGSAQASGVRVLARAGFDASAGPWGGFLTSGGSRGANGVVAELIAKGRRLVIVNPQAGPTGQGRGEIIDFDEQKTYTFMNDTREYRVQTFAQVRNDIGKGWRVSFGAIPGAEMFLPSTGVELPRQSRSRAKRFEYVVEKSETGRRIDMAGVHEARELVLTITAVERGKTLEQDGGWVVTNTVWLAPRIPAVDELVAMERRYVAATTKGVYETAFTQLEFPTNQFYDPFYPEHAIVGMRVIAETEKLEGTVVSSNTVYELERTAKEMKSAQSRYDAQQRRLGDSGARVLGGGPPKRARMVTMRLDYLSIDTHVTDADVALPVGYTKKK